MPTRQVINGKAFEYAIASAYYDCLTAKGLFVSIQADAEYTRCKGHYDTDISAAERVAFYTAALRTVDTLTALEPGLTAQSGATDVLSIRLASDAEGKAGDVRDVIFSRNFIKPKWEIGISAKNNHDASKHSRLSPVCDFGTEWIGYASSTRYFTEINVVFDKILGLIAATPGIEWKDVNNISHDEFYIPALQAFRKELLAIDANFDDVPQRLIGYLVGKFSFYKVIKRDTNNLVVVKAFNTLGGLHKKVNGVVARSKSSRLKLPTRIIELAFKPNSKTTLYMVLDNGWQIKFRIHSGDGPLNTSLKFDTELIGNPPVLFSQHLFL